MGKQESGHQKRKRKEREQDFLKTQKGAMDRFIRKESSQVPSGNQSADPSTLALAIIPHNDSRDGQTETDNIEVEEDNIDVNLNSSPAADDDVLFSLIYLIQDIGILLILNKLIF